MSESLRIFTFLFIENELLILKYLDIVAEISPLSRFGNIKYGLGVISLMLLSLFRTEHLVAQVSESSSTEVSTTQLWLDFFPHFFIKEGWIYDGDIGFRTRVDDDTWKRYYFRPGVRYLLSDRVELRGGLGVFYDDNKIQTNTFEFSPYQGIHARWPVLGRLRFIHYVRFEERSVWEQSVDDGYTFELRFRYQLSAKYLFCQPCGDEYWYAQARGEAFHPVISEVDEVYRNRTRLTVGAGYQQSRKWTFEINYNWQRSKTGPNDSFDVADHIIRLQVRRRLYGLESKE